MPVYIRPYSLHLLSSEEPLTEKVVYHTRVCVNIEDFGDNIQLELTELTQYDPHRAKIRPCEVCLNPEYEVIYQGGKHYPQEELDYYDRVQKEQNELAASYIEHLTIRNR